MRIVYSPSQDYIKKHFMLTEVHIFTFYGLNNAEFFHKVLESQVSPELPMVITWRGYWGNKQGYPVQGPSKPLSVFSTVWGILK